MRVVLFVHRYFPVVGGVEKYIHRLAKALLSMGHAVDVVAGATLEGLPERQCHDGVTIHRFPALRSPARARCWLWRRFGLFQRADVIHVSNTHMLEYLWRMFGPALDRRKVFLTRHGMSYIHPVPDSEKRRALRSVKLAAGIVHDGAFIEKWLGVEPDVCPDQGLFPQADELDAVPEPLAASAVYIGRPEPDSGIGIYIDAARVLTRELGREFTLDVYGEGSLVPALRAVVARDELSVRFHGRRRDAQARLVEGCFAFLDGRMAIQEAMARRRLVCAAYVDPLKLDYVGGESFSPYIVTVGSGRELARKVLHYLEHPRERLEMVERAHLHARTLSWQRTAEVYLDLWRERLANPRPRCSWTELLRLAMTLNREAGLPKPEWAFRSAIRAVTT